MRNRSTVRYYLLIAFFLIFLFFTNDFGLIDIQKTALVLAVGIDKENEQFSLTTLIAVPQKSSEGQTTSVQIKTEGKTIAEAFSLVNTRTGWYPKLIFCDLILLGETTINEDVFNGLDFFLRDNYMSDGCFVATCEGNASDLLKKQTPIETVSVLSIKKVLSKHSASLGTAIPTTLKDFSIGYFGHGKSGILPLIKAEKIANTPSSEEPSNESSNKSSSNSSSSNANNKNSSSNTTEKKDTIFSAKTSVMFHNGVKTGSLLEEDNFALSILTQKLRLADYTVEYEGETFSLLLRKNNPNINFYFDNNNQAKLDISVKLVAEIRDTSSCQNIQELTGLGNVRSAVAKAAEKKLTSQINTLFEKARDSSCDLLDVIGRLKIEDHYHYNAYKENILSMVKVKIKVNFGTLR